MVYKENPIKMDDLGVPPFKETPIPPEVFPVIEWYTFGVKLSNLNRWESDRHPILVLVTDGLSSHRKIRRKNPGTL